MNFFCGQYSRRIKLEQTSRFWIHLGIQLIKQGNQTKSLENQSTRSSSELEFWESLATSS